MNHTPSLKTYYQGILMGIETFTAYQKRAFTEEQAQCCEKILTQFEQFKLETAHAMETAGQPLPNGLPLYQAALAGCSAFRIQRLSDAVSFSLRSAADYFKGLEMMEKFPQKHQQNLPAQWLELIIRQIQETYTLGGELGLLKHDPVQQEAFRRPSAEP